MIMDWFYIVHGVRQWIENEEATAIIEAAMLFPPMLTMLMGVFDLGNGIMLGQKTITSSQTAADLTARDRTVNAGEMEQIISAAQLAYEPFGLNGFGIDIASVRFDANQRPVVLWRVTRDMPPNQNAVESVNGLAPEGEGMVISTVRYSYRPLFASLFMDDFNFQEVAFARGRRSPTIVWE
jgi:Flp pilus assembly protein TadG